MKEAKYKLYDRVIIFGREVTIIDLYIDNNEFRYIGQGSEGQEYFSENHVETNEIKTKKVKTDFGIGDVVTVIDTIGDSVALDNTSIDRSMEKGVVSYVDTEGIDVVYRVTFLDGGFAYCMPSRLMSISEEEECNKDCTFKSGDVKSISLVDLSDTKRPTYNFDIVDDVIKQAIRELDALSNNDTPLRNVFKESVTNLKVHKEFSDFDNPNAGLKLEKDINDFYRIDLNPNNPLEDKLIVSASMFRALFVAMREML